MRVLVIDDDPGGRRLAIHALRQDFPSAEIVEIGTEDALATALQDPAVPVLAIIDYVLTWSDGRAVFERIKVAYPHCPVIVFTGVGDETLAVQLLKAGVDDYVVKHGPRPLAEAVRKAIKHAAEPGSLAM
jgi:two-component system, cell cycle sensor histidine kinase and response regulator CckA